LQGGGACPSSHWARAGVHPGQIAITGRHRDTQPSTLTLTPRVAGENPHIHRENMQTPHRKNQPGFEPGKPGCEETVLTTTPPCNPPQKHG